LNSMNSITSKRDENKKRILLWVNLSVLPVSSSNDRFFLLFLIHLCNLTLSVRSPQILFIFHKKILGPNVSISLKS
jgi:hypothetical protein